MFGLGAGELFLIFFIALIFLGPKKLPGLARSMGQSIKEFQKALNPNNVENVENKESNQSSNDQNVSSVESTSDSESNNKL